MEPDFNPWLVALLSVLGLAAAGSVLTLVRVYHARIAERSRAYAERLARAEGQLLHQATHDALTGLPNRGVFLCALQDAIERTSSGAQTAFAVFFVDMDRFKFINDSFGHAAGDELLRQVSRRLVTELQRQDGGHQITGNLVCRFGGDEFLVLLNSAGAPVNTGHVAEGLLAALSSGFSIFGKEVYCGASIGMVSSDQCCSSADEVVRNADVAMYEAKRAGRNGYMVFQETMHAEMSRHVLIESSLRRAIGTDELSVVYQPIVELSSGKLISAEALVRWQHPVLGCISPAEFIPIAEETGLIVALDKWVREQAFGAMKEWRQRNPRTAPATISVNVSRAELARNQVFKAELAELLQAFDLPPECLQLEVTERDVMRNPEDALQLLRDLKALGIKLAMDDFGTGTSSLALLRTYPFDTIKIDRSFVQGLIGSNDVLAVIHATITLVEHLGMASLVEGIEEEAQVAVLLSSGCRFGQGYLFSRAVASDRLIESVRRKISPIRPNGVSSLGEVIRPARLQPRLVS
jgi:diguanylate cyclase (GGDEF)-like protein